MYKQTKVNFLNKTSNVICSGYSKFPFRSLCKANHEFIKSGKLIDASFSKRLYTGRGYKESLVCFKLYCKCGPRRQSCRNILLF